MSSIPKNSLFADFVFREDELLFELKPAGSSKYVHKILRNALYSVRGKLMRVCSNDDYAQCHFSFFAGISEVEESTRKLSDRFSKPFKKSKIHMKFEDGTREKFAMELIKFAWDNGFPLENIEFRLKNASPESIRELLNGCHEHCTSLDIKTIVPIGFKCTPPPGEYKIESFAVDSYLFAPVHWVNLDDFLQCREVSSRTGLPGLTVEYLNGLLKKILNLECKIERFAFTLWSISSTDFAAIVDGLSGSEIRTMQEGRWQGLQFERKDGLKLLVYHTAGYLALNEDDL